MLFHYNIPSYASHTAPLKQYHPSQVFIPSNTQRSPLHFTISPPTDGEKVIWGCSAAGKNPKPIGFGALLIPTSRINLKTTWPFSSIWSGRPAEGCRLVNTWIHTLPFSSSPKVVLEYQNSLDRVWSLYSYLAGLLLCCPGYGRVPWAHWCDGKPELVMI